MPFEPFPTVSVATEDVAAVESAAESVVLTTSPDAVDVAEELLPQPAIPAVITAARPIAISLFVFM